MMKSELIESIGDIIVLESSEEGVDNVVIECDFDMRLQCLVDDDGERRD